MIHLIEKLVTGTHLVLKIFIVTVQEVEVFQRILIIVNWVKLGRLQEL